MHMTPAEFDSQDFYRMNAVLTAKSEKDRLVVDPLEFLNQVGPQG